MSHAQTSGTAAVTVSEKDRVAARKRRNLIENLQSGQFLLPVLLIFVVVTVIPFFISIVYSFTDYSGYDFATSQWVGLSNYKTVFTDPTILEGLGFTLLYAIATTVMTTLIALPLALALNRKFIGHNIARSVFFFLSVPSMALLGLVWQYIVSSLESGALNTFLMKVFHVGPVPFLSDPNWAKACIIFIAVWASMGWHATLYLAYLQAIPADLYEQAQVDGANGWQQFVHITLPQMTPAISISVFMLLTSSLKVYDLPFTLTGGGPGYATYTVTQSIITTGIGSSRYGLGSALGVVFFICCIVLVALQQVITNLIERKLA